MIYLQKSTRSTKDNSIHFVLFQNTVTFFVLKYTHTIKSSFCFFIEHGRLTSKQCLSYHRYKLLSFFLTFIGLFVPKVCNINVCVQSAEFIVSFIFKVGDFLVFYKVNSNTRKHFEYIKYIIYTLSKAIKVVFFCKEFCLKMLTPLHTLSIIKKIKHGKFLKCLKFLGAINRVDIRHIFCHQNTGNGEENGEKW